MSTNINVDFIVLECNAVYVPTALDILSTFGFTLLLNIQVISTLTMSVCSRTMNMVLIGLGTYGHILLPSQSQVACSCEHAAYALDP